MEHGQRGVRTKVLQLSVTLEVAKRAGPKEDRRSSWRDRGEPGAGGRGAERETASERAMGSVTGSKKPSRRP